MESTGMDVTARTVYGGTGMNNAEAVNWLINITADIGKIEHKDLWHYEQALSEIREMLEDAPTIEPESQIIYSKAGYIMSLHKEYGCTLTRAEEAHNKALEYLRDKAMMKG